MTRRAAHLIVAALGLALVMPISVIAADPPSPTKYIGSLDGGASYEFFVPKDWNGTLFLLSPGSQGAPNRPRLAYDPMTRQWLLDQKFALAGGTYPCGDCYEPMDMERSQIQVLDKFSQIVGKPVRPIAWGLSFGASATAFLVKFHPERFAGAAAMCPYRIEGSIGNYNERLDHAFVLKTLLGFDQPLVNIGRGRGQIQTYYDRELAVIDHAQQTPAGRARLALAEAMVNTPDWGADNDPFGVKPAPGDFAARESNQYQIARTFALFYDVERAFFESRVGSWNQAGDGSVTGGNFSWNAAVDYAAQLARSEDSALVRGLYDQAGLSLTDDLAQLRSAPRIGADPGAVSALEAIDPVFGDVGAVQVVTLNDEGDPVAFVNTAQGYGDAVTAAGEADELRQLFVRRAGHCQFTSAEEITTLRTLLDRLDSGAWPTTAAGALNAAASSLGAPYTTHAVADQGRQLQPSFDDFGVPAFLRNFNTLSTNPYP